MLSKSNKIFFSSAGGLLLLAVILLSILTKTIDFTAETNNASELLNNWKLEEAENKLQQITSVETPSFTALKLYLHTLLLRGKYLKAKTLFERHFSGIKNIDHKVMLDFAVVNYYLGNMHTADSLCQFIINHSIDADSLRNISRAYNIIGLTKFFLGQYHSALDFQTKALSAAKSGNAFKEEADALRQLGVLAWYKGELDSALKKYYEPALMLYRKTNDKHGEATTLSDIGLLYFDWKDWKTEFHYQTQALTIRRQIGDLMGIADSYYFFEHFPKLSKELEMLKYDLNRESFSLSKELGYKWGAEIAANSLQQFFNQNDELFGKFVFQSDSINYTSTEGNFINSVNLFQAGNKYKQDVTAIGFYKNLLEIVDSLDYVVYKFQYLIWLANSFMDQGILLEASTSLKKAESLIGINNRPKFNYRAIEILKAKLAFKKKNYSAALAKLKLLARYYDGLYSAELNNMKDVADWQSTLFSIYKDRDWVFALLYDLLYEMNDQELFFNCAERDRKLVNWNNYSALSANNKNNITKLFKELTSPVNKEKSGNSIDSLLNIFQNLIDREKRQTIANTAIFPKNINENDLTISSFQKSLNKDDLFIEFAEGEDYFYVLGIGKEKSSLKRIPLQKNELREAVFFFRKAIERGRWMPEDIEWQKPARYLFSVLLEPLLKEEKFYGINNIVFSPHNILYLLPFSALVIEPCIGQTPHFMIEKYSLSYSSSAYDYLNFLKMPELNFSSMLFLASENKSLRYTEKEAAQIPGNLFYRKEILTGENASSKTFLAKTHFYDVIHIASHSNVDLINPLSSRIKFSDTSLLVTDFLASSLKADLVILSSCESGVSTGTMENVPSSLDIISFPKALLTAGCKSVLSTLWIIDDLSASEVMKQFYYNLLKQKQTNTIQLSKALSEAQNSYISSNQNKIHPFYWASFAIAQ